MSIATITPVSVNSLAALREFVSDCASKKLPIVDYGVEHAGVGHAPPDTYARLDLRPFDSNNGVIEHYTRDLTVRASAAAKLGELQRALAPSKQFIPIDADDDLTLGEIINHHVYGALRCSYGSIRDLLLGLHFVDGQGRDIHVGGRTVKNVAGLDMTRLMVGSLGELGIVHEATLRTYAIPEEALLVDVEINDLAPLDELLPRWLVTEARPAALKLSNVTGKWTLRIGYFGRITGTTAQLRSLETLLDSCSPLGAHIVGTGHRTVQADLTELALRRRWRRDVTSLAKVVVPPAKTGATCAALEKWSRANGPIKVAAMPVHGCLFVGGNLDASGAIALDNEINRLITSVAGFRVWHRRPSDTAAIAPFAPAQPDWAIMAKLKQTLDPQRIFNPGRLLRTTAPTPNTQ